MYSKIDYGNLDDMDLGNTHIGTSGYSYNHWKEIFYPKDLVHDAWLEFYSRFFNTVELNTTFYNLPAIKTVKRWHEVTSGNFRFSIKGPRIITHFKKLKDISPYIDNFYETIACLQNKREIILWQFPPNLELDQKRFKDFIEILRKFPARYAFELRNATWFNAFVYTLLESLNATLVLSDRPFNVLLENQKTFSQLDRPIIRIPQTSNFIYIRKHGPTSLYASAYTDDQFDNDATAIDTFLKQGNNTFIYFNNDAFGNAVKNAERLQNLLS